MIVCLVYLIVNFSVVRLSVSSADASGALEEEPEESSLSILLRELFISSSTLLKFADMIFTVSSSRETIFHPESVLITG